MRIAHLTLALALIAGVSTKPVLADSGSYLAARSAMISSDYAEAAQYYSQALTRDPSNPSILENAVNAYIGLGDLDRAASKVRLPGLSSMATAPYKVSGMLCWPCRKAIRLVRCLTGFHGPGHLLAKVK